MCFAGAFTPWGLDFIRIFMLRAIIYISAGAILFYIDFFLFLMHGLSNYTQW